MQWTSVNPAKSAFVAFKVPVEHFELYQFDAALWTTQSSSAEGQASRIQYKLPVRKLAQLFKSKASMTHLETCEWRLSERVARGTMTTPTLHLTFYHVHGVTKRHKLHIEEADVLLPTFQRHLFVNTWTAQPKLMAAWLTHFNPNVDEISLVTSPEAMTIRTTMDTSLDPRKPRGLATEMSVHLDDFELFDVAQSATLTFNFKEWRTVLQYAEANQVPIVAAFERGGRLIPSSLFAFICPVSLFNLDR